MSDIEKPDLASENQRLRERVAELENLAGQNAEWAEEARDRATKAEAERDAALAQVAMLREGGGLCAAPSCEGHCGYVHARGCEAVREYLADHGGEPYRAPSKAVTRG